MTNNVKLSYDSIFDGEGTAPLFKSRHGLEHIPYGDSKSGKKLETYPDDLISYKNNCGIHNAILEFKIKQVAGGGFKTDDSKTKDFLDNINDEEDANEILDKISNDLEIFGGFAILVNWSKNWKSIASVEHISFDKIRSGVINEEGKVEEYYYCWDWSTQRMLKTTIPAFNYSNAKTLAENFDIAVTKGDNKELNNIQLKPTTQLLYFKEYTPGSFYYPLPSYVGAISAIRADINSDVYGEKVMKNGFAATTHIDITGNYSNEEKLNEVQVLVDNYVGAENAGMPFVTFSRDENDKTTVNTIDQETSENKYKTITEVTRQKILTGHRVTSPLLMGIALSGTLGNRDEIDTAYELFYSSVIKPDQFKIIKVFNKVLKINGLSEVYLEKLGLIDEQSMNKGNDIVDNVDSSTNVLNENNIE